MSDKKGLLLSSLEKFEVHNATQEEKYNILSDNIDFGSNELFR